MDRVGFVYHIMDCFRKIKKIKIKSNPKKLLRKKCFRKCDQNVLNKHMN